MIKKIFLLGFFLWMTFLPPVTYAAGPKYTMRQRFGVGSDGGEAMKMQGNGWYFSWSYLGGKKLNNQIEFMGMLGAGGGADFPPQPAPENPESATCQWYKNFILSTGKEYYPDGMLWTIGNEIGWDDGRTPEQYADDFVKWRACLKSINSTYQVGTGALVSLHHKLPRDSVQGCSSNPAVDGGKAYFTKYINRLKNVYQVIPDFVVNHAYTYCRPGWQTAANFKTEIAEQRQLMKDLGLQNVDLIINEWANFSDESMAYLKETVAYLMNATNASTGHPGDENRLVQRWAWFIFVNTDDHPEWEKAWLYNSHTGDLTALGYAYKSMIPDPSPVGSYSADQNYSPSPCSIYGWACDLSFVEKPLQIDLYVKDATTNNQYVFVGSAGANLLHSNSADPVVKNSCAGTNNHDFVYVLPQNSQFRDGREHTFYAAAINIDSTGSRVDKDAAGNSKHTWPSFWHTNVLLCPSISPTVTPLPTSRPGDLTEDGQINYLDYSILMANWGRPAKLPQGDLQSDNVINNFDWVKMVKLAGN